MSEELIINKEIILPGEQSIIRVNVGRLPSGTSIFIYLHVYRSPNPGPVMLAMGGLHGDEINGVEIVKRCIMKGVFNEITAGSVIAIPLLNVYGFINFSRDVPDGKDVNRSFPGNLAGSLAARVARTLTKQILPHVDFGIDFHTGGSTRYNYPQIRYSRRDDAGKDLALKFAAPFSLEKAVIKGSLRKVARDNNIPVIVFEGGESRRLDGMSIEIGIQGLQRVLHSKGMLNTSTPPMYKIRNFVNTGWLRAADAGMFEWTKSSGHKVRKGEPLGIITEPYGRRQTVVYARREGFIIGHNNAAVVNQGDALFHLAYDEANL